MVTLTMHTGTGGISKTFEGNKAVEEIKIAVWDFSFAAFDRRTSEKSVESSVVYAISNDRQRHRPQVVKEIKIAVATFR